LPESGPICDLGFMAKRLPSPPAEPVPVPLRATFGANLKAARIKAGLKQADLASVANITQAYVSQIEAGTGNVSLDLAETLSAAVGRLTLDLLKPPRPRSRK
jgi:DNA-binding XRE family transcriptional regulator